MELEVVLRDDQSDTEGAAVAEGLMQALGLTGADALASACLDLLAATRGA